MAQLELFSSAADWLLPSSDALWHWDGEGEAIVWMDGTTLLFREELAQIVERLSGEGLPSLNVVVLLMAACRGKFPSEDYVKNRMDQVLESAKDSDALSTPKIGLVHEKAEKFYLEALTTLRGLSKYPSDLLSGVPAKTHLVERLAKSFQRGGIVEAKAVLSVLKEGLPLLEVPSTPKAEKNGNLLGDLFGLHLALGKLTPESFKQSLGTGLEILPQAQGIALHPADCMKMFLEELRQDPEFSEMARLTRDIMATLSLPRALEHPETQSMGGLSDISNRGPFHRLLVSELAHDNDTLAIRVAMNEALYLRNEPPAARPRSALIIVVDAGIRMWGIPRVFATAAAMALIVKVDKTTNLNVFRPGEKHLVPIDLTAREGMIKHLSALETNIHAGTYLEGLPQEESLPIDLAIITHPRAMEEPEFKAALNVLNLRNLYLVSVDREGNLQLDIKTPAGSKTLQRAHLVLEDIVGSESSKALRPDSARLPMVLSIQPFPLLLPLPDMIERAMTVPEIGFVAITKNGAICRWKKQQQGATTYPVALLKGDTKAFLFEDSLKCLILVKYQSTQREVTLFRWFSEPDPDFCNSGILSTIKDAPGDPIDVTMRQGILFVAYSHQIDLVEVKTGVVIGRFPIPAGQISLGAGFFFDSNSELLSLLGWSGTALETYPVKLSSRVSPSKILKVFCPFGGEKAWIVDARGLVASTVDESLFLRAPVGNVRDVKISMDGCRVWLQGVGDSSFFVDVDKREVKESSRYMGDHWLNPPFTPPKWTMRCRFTHIALEDTGNLWLRSGKGHWNRIEFRENKFQLIRYEKPASPGQESALANAHPFKPIEGLNSAGYTLQMVNWADGSKAFLDSRGLLHLQSSRVDIPELCIALAESTSLPIWSSDGLKSGPTFFFGDVSLVASDATTFDEYIRRFIGEIL